MTLPGASAFWAKAKDRCWCLRSASAAARALAPGSEVEGTAPACPLEDLFDSEGGGKYPEEEASPLGRLPVTPDSWNPLPHVSAGLMMSPPVPEVDCCWDRILPPPPLPEANC